MEKAAYLAGVFAGLDDRAQDLQCGDQPVAGRRIVAEDDMPGLLTAEIAADTAHLLDDIPVADRGAMQPDAAVGEAPFEAKIGHDRRNQGAARKPSVAR